MDTDKSFVFLMERMPTILIVITVVGSDVSMGIALHYSFWADLLIQSTNAPKSPPFHLFLLFTFITKNEQ